MVLNQLIPTAEGTSAARFFLCFGSSAFISSSRRPSGRRCWSRRERKKKREEIAGAGSDGGRETVAAVRQVEVSNNVHCGKPPLHRRRNTCLDRANLLSVQHHLRPSTLHHISEPRASLIFDLQRFLSFRIGTALSSCALRLRALHRVCVSRGFSVVWLRTNPTGE